MSCRRVLFLSLLLLLFSSTINAELVGFRHLPLPSDREEAPVSQRPDTLFFFAPDGPGSYGTSGTSERGFDFDGYGECMPAGWTSFGPFAVLRLNNFLPGENETCMWTFFDPDTTEPDYPMGVYPYGPPYWDMHIESPALEKDQHGNPMSIEYGDGPLIFFYNAYLDMPQDALIYFSLDLAVRSASGDYTFFEYDHMSYFGEGGWTPLEWDLTERAFELAGGPESVITGIKVRMWLWDMCPYWCDLYGDGYPHTLAALYDNISLYTIPAATAAPDDAVSAATMRLEVHPNPFNPQTELSLHLEEAGSVSLSVHDLSGRRLRQLLAEEMGAGTHAIQWDGRDDAGIPLASGVYIARLESQGVVHSKKVTLLK